MEEVTERFKADLLLDQSKLDETHTQLMDIRLGQLFIVMLSLGVIMSLFGFFLRYVKVQKTEDKILKLRLEQAQLEVSNTGT